MVLGDAVSKLETFVWIKVDNFVYVNPKNIKLGKLTNLNMIFYVMVSDYRLVKI